MIFLGVKPFLENFIESYRFGTHLFLPLIDLSKMCAEKVSYNQFSRQRLSGRPTLADFLLFTAFWG